MTSGLKGKHIVIAIEASVKNELQNQFSFYYCLNVHYLETSLEWKLSCYSQLLHTTESLQYQVLWGVGML